MVNIWAAQQGYGKIELATFLSQHQHAHDLKQPNPEAAMHTMRFFA